MAAVVTAAVLRLPLASGSLWWDELWNVRNATLGEWRQAPETSPDTPPEFRASSWERAFWYYGKPTNHAVQTVPSRLSALTWQRLSGSAPGSINEIALRLPVLLGGLLGIWLTAGLARRWAGDTAGVAAAWLMALHPWLLRYGVDARSYGMTIWLVPFTLRAADEALVPPGGGPLRWWWAMAAGFCLLMWAHVLSHAALCTTLFAAGVAVVIRRNPDAALRRRLLLRLVVVTAVAAGAFLLLFLPCLVQALCWHERNQDGNLLTIAYLLETLSQAGAGEAKPLHPAALVFLTLAAAGLVARGGLPRRGRFWLLVAGAGFLGFAIAVRLTGFYFYHRFLVGAAPLLVIAAAAALAHPRLPRLAAPAGVAMLGLLWLPTLRPLLTRSYCPWRESADLLRTELARSDGKAIVAGFGLGGNLLGSYLPEARDLRSGGLAPLIEEARRTGRPLAVAWAYDGYLRDRLPQDMALLHDAAQFTIIATLPGIEDQFTCRVARWNGPQPILTPPASPP